MKICKKICMFALGFLGISSSALCIPRIIKIVEGFVLEESFLSVYGGRNNYIKTALYGTVYGTDEKTPLFGIKVALYDGTNELASVITDENGTFYFDDISVWAGLNVKYTMIVSDFAGNFKPLRRDILFEIDEVTREEVVVLEHK